MQNTTLKEHALIDRYLNALDMLCSVLRKTPAMEDLYREDWEFAVRDAVRDHKEHFRGEEKFFHNITILYDEWNKRVPRERPSWIVRFLRRL